MAGFRERKGAIVVKFGEQNENRRSSGKKVTKGIKVFWEECDPTISRRKTYLRKHEKD